MALVIHENFTYKGRPLKQGDILFGDEADEVARHPVFARKCSSADDKFFADLKPAGGKSK